MIDLVNRKKDGDKILPETFTLPFFAEDDDFSNLKLSFENLLSKTEKGSVESGLGRGLETVDTNGSSFFSTLLSVKGSCEKGSFAKGSACVKGSSAAKGSVDTKGSGTTLELRFPFVDVEEEFDTLEV